MPTAAASSAPAAATGTGTSLGAMPASIPALPLMSTAAAPLSVSWSQLGNDLPALPKKLLTKIRNWEYIELADLLPVPHSAGDPYVNGPPAARFPLFPGCEVVRHKRRQIVSISQWTQAFTIYTAALELLAYMLTPIRASQQYDGLCWRSYDTNHRIAAAASGNRSWSKLDTDLFTRFFTGRVRKVNPCMVCDALTHTSIDCPEAPAQTKRDEARQVTGPHPETPTPIH